MTLIGPTHKVAIVPPLILFCSDPLEPRRPDQAFGAEAQAVEKLGLAHDLVDFEALTLEHSADRAVRRLKHREVLATAIYRGWMMKSSEYQELYEALAAKNVRLINDLPAYRHCHYLPESYAAIKSHTPRSVWMEVTGGLATDELLELLRPFGSAPVIVKDYVKSRKHEWEEACFIPSASDRSAVERVVRRFLELQGDDLNEGLVFREFVEFEPLAAHPKSGMPLTEEFRLFFLDQQPIFWAQYWEEGNYKGIVPPIEHFSRLAKNVKSRFFTMDVAKRRDGDWLVVELGDGQVAGLPERADAGSFYRAIAATWPAE